MASAVRGSRSWHGGRWHGGQRRGWWSARFGAAAPACCAARRYKRPPRSSSSAGAHAQLAPTARPDRRHGRRPARPASAKPRRQTTVNQSSQRAAIDWRSFDVGSQHTVQFNQPSTQRGHAEPGDRARPVADRRTDQRQRQHHHHQPAGVYVHRGAQVNANSLVVSAPGITNQNFMAGRMVFDQTPNPNATVSNAGTITVKQTGLAALVAPRVANSGVINARLGQVVLAGAEAHTIDLYGDGLVAIDVTKAGDAGAARAGRQAGHRAGHQHRHGHRRWRHGADHRPAPPTASCRTWSKPAGGSRPTRPAAAPARSRSPGSAARVRIEGQVAADGGVGRAGGRSRSAQPTP